MKGRMWRRRSPAVVDQPDGQELRCSSGEQHQEDHQDPDQLVEELSRMLVDREEQLFHPDGSTQDAEDLLQKDFGTLQQRLQMILEETFSSSSSKYLGTLRSAVTTIQQQEEQDQRWTQADPDGRHPAWRPLGCARAHNLLLQDMVQSRMTKAAEDQSTRGGGGLSSPVKRQIYSLGRCVEEDLLLVVQVVQACYPSHMDIVNVYAGLYHQQFSAQLIQIAASRLDVQDCSYLLFMVNHHYPETILKHKDLGERIKTDSLRSLLLKDDLTRLEEQYLIHKENTVKTWLSTALRKEEEAWTNGEEAELIDSFCFSPLARDAIQQTRVQRGVQPRVQHGVRLGGQLGVQRQVQPGMQRQGCVIGDQSKGQRITAHLEGFLRSYETSLARFVKSDQANVDSVVKGQLVCEQQLRDYITDVGVLSEQQRHRCLEVLTTLRDCAYRFFTCPIRTHLKRGLSQLWTTSWLDGSLPVVPLLLDSLNHWLVNLTDLRSDCRESVLSVVHQDLVLVYLKRLIKTTKKSQDQQLGGAQRMKEDSQKINEFFTEGGCSLSLWLGEVLCSLVEVLRLQDPQSVQLEMTTLSWKFPDLREDHMVALLSLKTGLSAANIRSICQSVKETRLPETRLPKDSTCAPETRLSEGSTNHSPAFFSKLRLKPLDKIKHKARTFYR